MGHGVVAGRVWTGFKACFVCIAGVTRVMAVLVAALVLSSPAMADEWSLLVNGTARHLDVPANVHFNEANWGAGVQYDFDVRPDNWVPFVTASGFLDSYKNPSYYAGGGVAKRFTPGPENWGMHVDLGGIAFLMQRQNFRGDMPFFGVLPVLTLGVGKVSVNATYIPRVQPKGVPLLFFQLKLGIR